MLKELASANDITVEPEATPSGSRKHPREEDHEADDGPSSKVAALGQASRPDAPSSVSSAPTGLEAAPGHPFLGSTSLDQLLGTTDFDFLHQGETARHPSRSPFNSVVSPLAPLYGNGWGSSDLNPSMVLNPTFQGFPFHPEALEGDGLLAELMSGFANPNPSSQNNQYSGGFWSEQGSQK